MSGVDRSGDPFKHGNYSGTHPQGGVLLVYGDDHPGKSSTIANHSQQALAANSIPTLYPADVSEFATFSLLGWAVLAALLAGRRWQGWRGRRATRWLYVGAVLLLLAYVGSRFVFEVLLARGSN